MLKIENISKTFNPGTINEKVALQDLSLHLAPGDFVTIIGSNGAGKSTLFNAICGSFFTDSGSIYLDGRNITFLPEYQRSRQIGRLFQDPMRGSAPHMTIEENLSLAAASGGWLSHVTRAEKAAFREKLAQLDMGLEDRMRQFQERMQQLEPGQENIVPLMRQAIENWTPAAQAEEVGQVLTVGDEIATVSGLERAEYGEILVFSNGVKGMVQDLRRNEIGCVLFGDDAEITEGSLVRRSGKTAGIPVGDGFLGRVVDALGTPIDGTVSSPSAMVKKLQKWCNQK